MQSYRKSLLLLVALAAVVGLVATLPCAADFTVTDLGVLDGFTYSRAAAVNASGQVVGDSFNGTPGDPSDSTSSQAFVWQESTGLVALPLLEGFANSYAVDINASGQIVGTCWNSYYCCDCDSQACLWQYNTDTSRWEVTGLVDLAAHVGSVATAINDAGQVLFHSIGVPNPEGTYPGPYCGATLWENGTLTDLTHDGGGPIWPDAINANGQVLGWTCCATLDQAVVWDGPGAVTVLAPSMDGNTDGYAINGLGEVVGYGRDAGQSYDFLWLPADAYGLTAGINSSLQEGGYCCSATSAINDAGLTFGFKTKYMNGRPKSELTIRDLTTGLPIASALLPRTRNGFSDSLPGVMNASGGVVGGCDVSPSTAIYAGYYFSADTGHAYLPSISGPVLDDFTWASSIDDAGHIVGFSRPAEGQVHAALWSGTPPVNEAPVLDALTTPINAAVGIPVTFTATSTDANVGDHDFLTYTMTNAPAGANLNLATGAFSLLTYSVGSATFDVVVSDGELTDSQSVTINVAANEAPVLDAISTPISTAVRSAVTFTATASDAEGEPLIFGLSGAPAGATINATTGAFSWTPTAKGSFTFSVTVSDSNASDSQSVTVNVSDQDPVLNAISTPISAPILSAVTFTASASDAEGETLTFALSGAPAGATINATTGAFSWTPTTVGSFTFAVRVSDPNGSDSQDVTVNVTDQDPVLDAISTPISAPIFSEVTFTATASDAEGETLTFGLTGAPAGATINATTGAFSWTPGTVGSFTFTVTVSDPNGSDSQSVTVNATDEDPVLDAITTPIPIAVRSEVTFTASASDAEGETLTFGLSGAPAGATINATTGAFSWTPSTEGSYTFSVTVSDPNGSDSQSVTVNVSDQDPVLNAITTPIAKVVGSPVTFTATASDAEGETLTFGLSGAPAGATINATTGAFSWTPTTAGSFTFSVTVSDANGSDSQSVTVNVSALTVSSATATRNSRGSVLVTVTIRNPANATVNNVSVTAVTLGGIATSTRLPDAVAKSMRAGTTKTCKFQFTGVPAGSATFTLTGTSSVGGFSTTQTVSVP